MVIGVGNADRGDDAAGLIAVRRVRECAPGVRTAERSGDMVGLLEQWEGEERVILIDATCSGAAPGTVHRLNAHEAPVPFLGFRGSTHSWGVGEAVELARVLGRLPARLVVYGIEGASFTEGEELSLAVASAVEEVVRRVTNEVNGHA